MLILTVVKGVVKRVVIRRHLLMFHADGTALAGRVGRHCF